MRDHPQVYLFLRNLFVCQLVPFRVSTFYFSSIWHLCWLACGEQRCQVDVEKTSLSYLNKKYTVFLSYLKRIMFSGRRKRWQSTWQAILKSSEAWAPRHRFCLNHSMFRYFKSVWLLFWLPGVRATSNCWRSLSGHGLSIPWVALSFFGDRQTRQAPQTTCYWTKYRASPKKRGFSEIDFAPSLAFLWCGFCSYM